MLNILRRLKYLPPASEQIHPKMTSPSLSVSFMQWVHALHLKQIESVHIVCALFILISIPCGRRVFWMADAFFAQCIMGLALVIAPQIVLAPQTTGGSLDKVHVFLLRGVGAHLLSMGVPRLALRNTKDRALQASVMLGTVLANIFMMVAVGYSTYNMWERKGLHFNQKFPLLYMCVFFSSMLGNIVHSIRAGTVAHHCQQYSAQSRVGKLPDSLCCGCGGDLMANGQMHACGLVSRCHPRPWSGSAPRNNWIAVAMALDAAALMVTGLLHYAFPLQILKTVIKREFPLDGAHACFGRLSASLSLCSAYTAPYVAHFAQRREAKYFVVGRILTQAVHFLWNVHGHFQLDVFSMYHVTPFMLSGFFVTFLLSVFFRFAEVDGGAKARPAGARRSELTDGAKRGDKGHFSEPEGEKRLKGE